MSMNKSDPKFVKAYERGMLRSAIRSAFWSALSYRRQAHGLTFKDFAKLVGVSKHEISRWFNGDPNWTINTMAKLASALDMSVRIEVVDKKTGKIFTSSGEKVVKEAKQITSSCSTATGIVARKVSSAQLVEADKAKAA